MTPSDVISLFVGTDITKPDDFELPVSLYLYDGEQRTPVSDDVVYVATLAAYASLSGQLDDIDKYDVDALIIAAADGKTLYDAGVVSYGQLESELWRIMRHEQVEGERYQRSKIARQAAAGCECMN